MSGGEADAKRLLELASGELLENLLPELSGEARYRARLIANAMKIVRQELAAGSDNEAETLAQRRALAEETLGEAAAAGDREAVAAGLRDALRAGDLDGDERLYRLLVEETGRRQKLVGQR